jgi:hypothetical protein
VLAVLLNQSPVVALEFYQQQHIVSFKRMTMCRLIRSEYHCIVESLATVKEPQVFMELPRDPRSP